MRTNSLLSNEAAGGGLQGQYVYGIDISVYQKNEIDTLTAASGLSFVICKASEGITIQDPTFAHNWQAIAAKGFIRGAYHFYHTNDDPEQQAQNFLSVVGALAATDLPMVIDVEETSIHKNADGSAPDKTAVQTTLLAFLKIIEEKTGRKPMIYTDPNIGNAYLVNPVFSAYPLYLACYTSSAPTQLPGAWKGGSWTIWQKTASQVIGAFKNDYDVFNGDITALRNFIAGSPAV